MASEAAGQMLQPARREVSVRGGRIEGTVTDESGAGIVGASVLALGTALASARTDGEGRFALPLPQGEYVLRATREGYVSTYREPVRVQSDALLRRHITLTKTGQTKPVLLAGAAVAAPAADPEPALPESPSDQVQTDAAWRLRHLPRSVLRDASATAVFGDGRPPGVLDRPSFVDWLVGGIGDADFNGQVNFLATSAMPAIGPLAATQPDWARGIAYVVVGAPVGAYGDWSVRAATAAQALASWTLLTEYHARPDRTHAFKLGASYSAQDYSIPHGRQGVEGGRRVGGVSLADRWTIDRDAVLSYGVKVDSYDYLSDPALVSGHVGVGIGVLPHLRVVTQAASRTVAPGADQFLPPAASGVWLPPERTFSALRTGATLAPERVTHYAFGIETDIGPDRVIGVRRFSEESRDQLATLFGLDSVSQVGHYYIASPGDVRADGWTVGASGALADHVRGSVSYSTMSVDWTPAARLGSLRRVSPSSIRVSGRQEHEFSAGLDADLPASNTRVSLWVRLSNDFSAAQGAERRPVIGGRFKIEIQQRLPYAPVPGSEVNFLLSVRTLMRDLGDEGSLYDELLTVRPPLRLVSGVQMRF